MLAVVKVGTLLYLATQIVTLPETSTVYHRQVVLCAVNIVTRYVSEGQPLLVSVSNGDGFDEYRTVSSELLEELQALEQWPLYILYEETHGGLLQDPTTRKYLSYIVIPRRVQLGVEAMMESIISQVRNL